MKNIYELSCTETNQVSGGTFSLLTPFLSAITTAGSSLVSSGINTIANVTGVSAPVSSLLSAGGYAAMGIHYAAEETIAATGLQPIFSTFDKPIIHPLLWTPIAQVTGVAVDSHPAGL